MAADPYSGLQADFAARVRAVIAESGGRVKLVSGYRSPEYQAVLVKRAKKKHGKNWNRWVGRPGKSRHNHGIAVDLGGDLKLAAQLAAKHGLVRPMSWEPWHFEPAGARASKQAQTTPPNPADPTDTRAEPIRQEVARIEAERQRLRDPAVQLANFLDIVSGRFS